jgi:hypothetical protein
MRVVTTAEIAQHPFGSWSPRDYIYEVGDRVLHEDEEKVVTRQDVDDLWLATLEFVPGSRVIFSCTLPQGPSATIFEVKRPRERS